MKKLFILVGIVSFIFFSGNVYCAQKKKKNDVVQEIALSNEKLLKKEELRQKFLSNKNIEEIVFAVREPATADGHWYANFAYKMKPNTDKQCSVSDEELKTKLYSKGGGKLVKYNVKTNEYKVLLSDPEGAVRNPHVSYDGDKILFSYRKGGTEFYSLYEIDINGKNLTKLPIDGNWDDIEPCYLPNGDIVFISSRCYRIVPCWGTHVGILHRYFKNENVVRPISVNMDQDNTPCVMPDGKILYMRWEYIQRNQLNFHHLWKKNPDGSNDIVHFGNEIPKHLFIAPQAIPNSNDIIFTFCKGHGRREHTGKIARLSQPKNPSDESSLKLISSSFDFQSPYPIDNELILTTNFKDIIIMDMEGNTIPLEKLPRNLLMKNGESRETLAIYEPRIIRKREREREIPDMADYTQKDATVILMDSAIGRNMQNIKTGDIEKLLIVEALPTPAHSTGGSDPFTMNGAFTIERVLGTVKVESDGSANFKVPADRALAFVALDKDGKAVKRMQSFTSFAPGTTTSCIGCHEQRDLAPPKTQSVLKALQRPSDKIEKIFDGDEIIDFPRDIQPILNKHCIKCHNPDKYAGKLDLSGDFGPMFARSYYSLKTKKLFIDGNNENGNMPPYTFGSGGSIIAKKILKEHKKVKLSEEEKKKLFAWLDMGSFHASTYAAIETGQLGYLVYNKIIAPDKNWTEVKEMNDVFKRRCAECHKGDAYLPSLISGDPKEIQPWIFTSGKNNKKRYKLSHHSIFNLTRPDKSNILLEPLSKSQGGRADDSYKNSHKEIFKTKDDKDYQKILRAIERAKIYIDEENPHYLSKNFKPSQSYILKMKEYGILNGNEKNIDPFKTDKKYWDKVICPEPYKAN